MVTILLSGGLGNQMFQYAAAKALALRNDTDLVIDLRFFQGAAESSKLFRLREFAIEDKVKAYGQGFFSSAHHLPQRLTRLARLERFRTYKEPNLGFHFVATQLGKNAVLTGNFQSPLYFEDAEDEVVKRFQPVNQATRALWPRVPSENRINVHVRRGDYLHHDGFLLKNPLDYYERAIGAAQTTHPTAPVRIFSDDPAWCRSQKIFRNAEIVLPDSSKSPLEDLALMMNGCAIVIANSSYSWWAGFLAGRAGADVYAPKKWILDFDVDDIKIYPDYWTRV